VLDIKMIEGKRITLNNESGSKQSIL
jgi:hypothetical protein